MVKLHCELGFKRGFKCRSKWTWAGGYHNEALKRVINTSQSCPNAATMVKAYWFPSRPRCTIYKALLARPSHSLHAFDSVADNSTATAHSVRVDCLAAERINMTDSRGIKTPDLLINNLLYYWWMDHGQQETWLWLLTTSWPLHWRMPLDSSYDIGHAWLLFTHQHHKLRTK